MWENIFIYDLICRDFALILFNYNTLLIDPVAFLLKGQNLHYYLSRSFTKPIKSYKVNKRSNNNVVLLQGLQTHQREKQSSEADSCLWYCNAVKKNKSTGLGNMESAYMCTEPRPLHLKFWIASRWSISKAISWRLIGRKIWGVLGFYYPSLSCWHWLLFSPSLLPSPAFSFSSFHFTLSPVILCYN